MDGRIIGVRENSVLVDVSSLKLPDYNIVGFNIIFEYEDEKHIAEIISIDNNIMTTNLIGLIENGNFTPGFISKPSFNSQIRLLTKSEVSIMLGNQDLNDPNTLYLGKSKIYPDFNINVDINKLFGHHFAICGNTGAGKSFTVARIIQNIFYNQSVAPTRANIFIFDLYGEYQNAFNIFKSTNPELNFKSYTTNYNDQTRSLLQIPLWLLGTDDIALLLGATEHTQISIIEKALKYVTVFCQEESKVITYKNDVIARALLDILVSSRPAGQIRDQIMAVLSNFNTSQLNLSTQIVQPGYTRTLKQCLYVENNKMHEIELVTNFIQGYLSDGLTIDLPDGSFPYTLKDLEEAFEFALISEGVLKSDKVYDYTNILKVRLHTIINSPSALYFSYPEHISRERYIKRILTAETGYKAQIINFNINYVDDRLAKVITKIYSRLLFEFAAALPTRASFPIHIILEEAHRYVQNDNDIFLLGYNIFERIAKEGRKYGVILGLISQRPSELSETTLSQCSNFLILRMYHPKDLTYIRDMIPSVSEEISSKLKLLQPGSCIAFGTAFSTPSIIQMDKPNPEPNSANCDIRATWFEEIV